MTINFVCVGKIKEKFFSDAIAEYKKRLSKFCKLNIIETQEFTKDSMPNASEIAFMKQREGEKILPYLKGHVVLLDLGGAQQTSVEFSKFIEQKGVEGISEITFIIGGSHGVSRDIQKVANTIVSFGKMTFPHQLMRVVLIEQVYRAFMIKSGAAYHK